jgi:hypothetical protein
MSDEIKFTDTLKERTQDVTGLARRYRRFKFANRFAKARVMTRILLSILLMGGGLSMLALPYTHAIRLLYAQYPLLNLFVGFNASAVLMSVFGLFLLLIQPRYLWQLVFLTAPFFMLILHFIAGTLTGQLSIFASWFFLVMYGILLTMYYGFTEAL